MAERRMFAKSLTDSDAFLDMPLSAQTLYFHLAMHADDDGFVNSPRKIQRMIGGNDDDMRLLLAKQFIISFDSGVIVIRHWRMHNAIRKDRHKPTVYAAEMSALECDESGVYIGADYPLVTEEKRIDNHMTTTCQPNGRIGKGRLGKVSIDKGSIGECRGDVDIPPAAEIDRAPTDDKPKSKRFVKPTLEEVKTYFMHEGLKTDAELFFYHYEANGWRSNAGPLKDWRAAAKKWERNGFNNSGAKTAEQRQDAETRLAKLKARAI